MIDEKATAGKAGAAEASASPNKTSLIVRSSLVFLITLLIAVLISCGFLDEGYLDDILLIHQQYIPYDYALAFLIGAMTGFAEIADTRRSTLKELLKIYQSWIYIIFNGLASLAALYLINIFGWNFGVDAGNAKAVQAVQVLIAGFGTMILFRSSLFNLAVGEDKRAIGIYPILEKMLGIISNEIRQKEAKRISESVAELMAPLDFDKAAKNLPAVCAALVDIDDSSLEEINENVECLSGDDASLNNRAKLLNLGLILHKHYGESVIQAAVEALDEGIQGSPDK